MPLGGVDGFTSRGQTCPRLTFFHNPFAEPPRISAASHFAGNQAIQRDAASSSWWGWLAPAGTQSSPIRHLEAPALHPSSAKRRIFSRRKKSVSIDGKTLVKPVRNRNYLCLFRENL
jgi:hypothetical protein